MIDSFFRSLFTMSKFSVQVLHTFPEVPRSLNYITMKIHLNHCKDSPYILNFSFVWSAFCYRSSSWRLYMMVHQGFNSFSKCSLRFFLEELKHSPSCNPECNSFFCIIEGGIMPFLIIWVHVFTIHMLLRMGYFKSINLVIGIILGYISP